ncbi:tetratricopeptide repeat protein 4 isoform X2 [Echeneis naucrates]|uniref:tetratricopeptide repeat protein 4 isoform X2 n=1 Tax=Echeneis naucrates TaxID=173247 RepID=UPI0011133993|nr:tetratricopeptide repeat protein 4 isoform X2 [Echeneis naucrates]
MASPAAHSDSDDGMDALMDKFKTQRYKQGFNEGSWEEEFDKIPMFMKTAPEEIDPKTYPELACLQAIIHDEDRPPEEQAKTLKDEGNAFFKEKNYQKAILSYTAGLKKKCGDQELSTVLLTNRAAAHFHLGNMRSALNDAASAKKIKPDHLKALIRGAQCCTELRNFSEAIQWCDEGLRAHPTDKKLQELRAAANKHKRAAERDARKAKATGKKLLGEKEALLVAIKLYFEDEEKETLYQVNPEMSLLKVLQHKRFFVKAGTPAFIVLVKGSSFRKQFLTGKKLHGL